MLKKENIEIKTDYITLIQLLKWAGIVSTGGEGKALIKGESVQVNGELETRPGRKLIPGDTVSIGEEFHGVIVKNQ